MARADVRTFAFRYGSLRPLLSVLGMGPGLSRIEVGPDAVDVRMGWAFQATIPRPAIMAAVRRTGLVGGIGVHGWNGRWLVNGTTTGLVTLEIDPPARAHMIVPAHLRQLTMSLEDPDGFLAALGAVA